MRARPLLPALVALLLAVPACEIDVDVAPDTADPVAADPLPEPEPGADVWGRRSSVVVFDEPLEVDLRLELRPDGTYRLLAQVVERSGERERATSEGRYRWDGDRLTLIHDGGGTETFRLRGDELELDTEWPVTVAFAVTGLPDPTLRRVR